MWIERQPWCRLTRPLLPATFRYSLQEPSNHRLGVGTVVTQVALLDVALQRSVTDGIGATASLIVVRDSDGR